MKNMKKVKKFHLNKIRINYINFIFNSILFLLLFVIGIVLMIEDILNIWDLIKVLFICFSLLLFIFVSLLYIFFPIFTIDIKYKCVVLREEGKKLVFKFSEIDRFEYTFNECIRINLINGEYYEIQGYFTTNKEKFYFGNYIVNKNKKRNLDFVEKANKILIEYKKENGLKI